MTFIQQMEKIKAVEMLINAACYLRERKLGDEAYVLILTKAYDIIDEVEGYRRSLEIN